MKRFLGYIVDKGIKAIPRKKKVSPDIKSIRPSKTVREKGVKASVEKAKSDEFVKRIRLKEAAEKKLKTGKEMMKAGQKERKKLIDTGRAFQFRHSKGLAAIEPGEGSKFKDAFSKKPKPDKKFKTGKELEREKKMGGGMMGRRFGMKSGTPKPKTNVEKIKETFAVKGLKKIDPKKQKGLAKLKKARPDVVRKMGYFKRGGRS